MRHGVKSDASHKKIDDNPNLLNTRVPGDQLGCYFCSDIVAPGNVLIIFFFLRGE